MLKGWSGNNFIVPNNIYFGGSLIGSIPTTPSDLYPQIKIVAKSGSLYSTITDALNSITDANYNTKPYIIDVATPGGYDEVVALKSGVNIIARDPFNTYILRQVTDGGNPVHCDLRINIDNRQTDGTHGLYLTSSGSVVRFEGNITGAVGGSYGGKGIYNVGYLTVLNGNITGGRGNVGGKGIENNNFGKITLFNCNVIGGEGVVGAGGFGIENVTVGTVTFLNCNVTGGKGVTYGGRGIYNNGGGIITLSNGNITGGEGGGAGIYNYQSGVVIASNVNITGGKGAIGENSSYGIHNYSTGIIKVTNGKITTPSTLSTGYPIVGGHIVLTDCVIYGIHADVFAIYSGFANKTVKCTNVWSNRALHENITNLIEGGFHVDANVEI